MAKKKMCILEDDKLCDGCCDCDICDLDPVKICDNCAKCLENVDYKGVKIEKIDLYDDEK